MALILVMYVQNRSGEVDFVVSNVDNRRYLVRKMHDSQQAADLLAHINKDLVDLVQHLMAKYPSNEDCLLLFKNFDPSAVSEGSIDSGYTSYSVNKGEKIILCIRQKDDSFVDKNVLVYVAVHELAHIMTTEIGHTSMFWDNFRFILNEAILINLYHKVDADAMQSTNVIAQSIVTTSDERLKDIRGTVASAECLSKVRSLEVIEYAFNVHRFAKLCAYHLICI